MLYPEVGINLMVIALIILLLAGSMRSELDALVETERAFARLSVAKGTREAFLANLSDESVLFRPDPVPGKSWMDKSAPTTTQLDWQPEFADISSAADLGYTTGPWQLRRTPQDAPAAFGHYVTVWKKQTNGQWKIAIDVGIGHGEGPKSKLVDAPKFKAEVQKNLSDREIQEARSAVLDLENRLPARVDGYIPLFADDARLYRNDGFPLVGLAAIRKAIPKVNGPSTWNLAGINVARSADLAYAYGRVEGLNYLRIWKRRKTGSWRIVLDLVS